MLYREMTVSTLIKFLHPAQLAYKPPLPIALLGQSLRCFGAETLLRNIVCWVSRASAPDRQQMAA
jgi:hypothetical protein